MTGGEVGLVLMDADKLILWFYIFYLSEMEGKGLFLYHMNIYKYKYLYIYV